MPGLPNYRLDTLLAHFAIPMPANRHRAGVDVTAQVFTRLIDDATGSFALGDLASQVKVAGRTAKYNVPVQSGLFDPEHTPHDHPPTDPS
ncbi:hypothetical protein [Nocardia sp. alder85J]|uniref:hypothetical protein n=1 Tax=Nocardia sp. alder85J TaxID=2862949 RepID=UPI001CD8144A|nr:hypothetical protein [Nocardia sp. alder85J]MCX4095680.1 hypothetical protein [Nocardia sp. alder85J]